MQYKLINPINTSYSPVEQILTNRGIPRQDIEHYLHPTEDDNLSPLLLDNIKEAAQLLITHIQQEHKIQVVFDSDCDGYTSAALLLNYVNARFPSVINLFSYTTHEGKTHGLHDLELQEDVKLVVCPDSASNDYSYHQELQESGVDVLVLDHHIADKVSEYAVVVNNQLCDYPTKSLSGVAIVYKLCMYIDSMCGDRLSDRFIDLVAIGLTGDMCDQRDIETHYLTQLGLSRLRNPFIKGMAEKNSYSLGSVLSPIGVAFYIVPLMNAVTRVGTMEEKFLLFESMLDWKAYDMVPSTKRGCKGQEETRLEQSLRTCTNIKNRQTRLQDSAQAELEQQIEEENLLNHKLLVIKVKNPSFDKGITGLIANRLMAKYQRPTLLLSLNAAGEWAGSARGYSKGGLDDLRTFVRESRLARYAEGHPNAFGTCFTESNVDEFVRYADVKLQDIKFEPSYLVDYIYQANDFNPQDILDIGSLKQLWGQEINEALVAIEHVSITPEMLTLMSRDKHPTLKIQLSNGVACIKFKSGDEELESLTAPEGGCIVVNIVGKCEVNRYYNSVTPQILVEDYEIIQKVDYYF